MPTLTSPPTTIKFLSDNTTARLIQVEVKRSKIKDTKEWFPYEWVDAGYKNGFKFTATLKYLQGLIDTKLLEVL